MTVPDTSGNTSFSRQMPGLQLAVDSTSLGEFKICPRRYYYAIVLGWQTRVESVHLTFGILLHGARERYDHRRSAGDSHDDAVAFLAAVRRLSDLKPDLWLPAVPSDGQDANLGDGEWRGVIVDNYRAGYDRIRGLP